MIQVIEQTQEQKIEMYMKCTKHELVEMLIECNRILYTHSQVHKIKQNKK